MIKKNLPKPTGFFFCLLLLFFFGEGGVAIDPVMEDVSRK